MTLSRYHIYITNKEMNRPLPSYDMTHG